MEQEPTIASALGDFLASYRTKHGLTLDDVARTSRSYGARWSASSVRNIESGRAVTSLPNILCLGLALNDLTGETLTLPDMLGDAKHFFGPTGFDLPVTREWVHSALTGEPLTLQVADEHLKGGTKLADEIIQDIPRKFEKTVRELPYGIDWREVEGFSSKDNKSTLAEERAARKLGIKLSSLQIWAKHLWNQPFDDESTKRAELTGKPITPQLRGAMSRELIRELQEAKERSDAQHAEKKR